MRRRSALSVLGGAVGLVGTQVSVNAEPIRHVSSFTIAQRVATVAMMNGFDTRTFLHCDSIANDTPLSVDFTIPRDRHSIVRLDHAQISAGITAMRHRSLAEVLGIHSDYTDDRCAEIVIKSVAEILWSLFHFHFSTSSLCGFLPSASKPDGTRQTKAGVFENALFVEMTPKSIADGEFSNIVTWLQEVKRLVYEWQERLVVERIKSIAMSDFRRDNSVDGVLKDDTIVFGHGDLWGPGNLFFKSKAIEYREHSQLLSDRFYLVSKSNRPEYSFSPMEITAVRNYRGEVQKVSVRCSLWIENQQSISEKVHVVDKVSFG